MGISLKSSFNADKKSKELTRSLEQRLGRAMEFALGKLVRNIESGKGSDGPLKEYAPSTLKKKLKAGKGSTVNLTETGKMIQGIQSTVEQNSNGLLGKIFFLPTEQRKARWNIALRPNFFKLAKEQLANIVKTLRGK